MNLTQLIPGTGSFICGSCLRDNTLAAGLRARGHDVSTVPLYLPFKLEDGPDGGPVDAAHGPRPRESRVFLGGINMYLQQKAAVFRHLPGFLARWLDAPRLLRWSSSKGDMIDPHQLGAMTVSMIRGEDGRQARELEKLVAWLARERRPDAIVLSNVMLVGMARRLKADVGSPLVCTMQGEAPFLDALPEPHRSRAWAVVAERAGDVDAFVPVSRHYGDEMTQRMRLPAHRVHVVHNGIELDGLAPLEPEAAAARPPAIGYLARMCADKGLHTLVEAFILLKRRGTHASLKLRAGGAKLPADEAYVAKLQTRLAEAGVADDATFQANLDREGKRQLLQSLSVLSVPATYGESFGLYILEALACGVPVVQPRHGAFPEVVELTGGGLLCEPDDPGSLADGLDRLLTDRDEAAALARRGRQAVLDRFQADAMAAGVERVCQAVAGFP